MKHILILLGVLSAVALLRSADVPTTVAIPAIPAQLEQPPSRPGLEITADLMVVLLRSNMVYYSNNVIVVDPPAKPGDPPTVLRCDQLTGIRGTNGKLDSIVADGAVALKQGDLNGLGSRAVYTATNERIFLTGGYPGTGTNLPMLFTAQGLTNLGDAIIYDRAAGTLVTLRARTYIPPSTLRSATNSPSNTNTSRRAPFQL